MFICMYDLKQIVKNLLSRSDVRAPVATLLSHGIRNQVGADTLWSYCRKSKILSLNARQRFQTSIFEIFLEDFSNLLSVFTDIF